MFRYDGTVVGTGVAVVLGSVMVVDAGVTVVADSAIAGTIIVVGAGVT